MHQRYFCRRTHSIALLAHFAIAGPLYADPEPTGKAAAPPAGLEGFLYAGLKRSKTLGHPKWDISLTVNAVEGRTLVAPVLEHVAPSGAIDEVWRAKEGKLRVDPRRNRLILELIQATGESPEIRIEAARIVREVPLPADLGKQ